MSLWRRGVPEAQSRCARLAPSGVSCNSADPAKHESLRATRGTLAPQRPTHAMVSSRATRSGFVKRLARIASFRLAGVSLQFLSVAVVAWRLPMDVAGAYFVALGVIQVSCAVAKFGFDQLLVRELPMLRHAQAHGQAMGLLVFAMGFTALLSLAVGAVAINFVDEGVAFGTHRAILALTAATILMAAVQGLGASGAFTLLRDVVQPGFFTFAIAIAPASTTGHAVLFFELSCVITALIAVVVLGQHQRLAFAMVPLRETVRGALSLAGVSALVQAARWADTAVIGQFASAEVLAAYTPLSRGAALIRFPLSIVNAWYPPRAALLFSLDRKETLVRLTRMAVTLSIAFSGVIAMVLTAAHPAVIALLVPGRGSMDLSLAFTFLLVGQLVSAAVGPSGFLLTMTHLERLEVFSLAAGVLVLVVAIPPLTMAFGLVGASIGAGLVHTVINLVRASFVRLRHGVCVFSAIHLLVVGAIAATVLAGVVLDAHTASMIIAFVAAGLIGFVTYGRTRQELAQLRSIGDEEAIG